MKKICLFLLFLTASLSGTSKYPADVSYYIADIKYSKTDGVKICEVQQGILSRFSGDAYVHGDIGVICPQIEQLFGEFPIKKWSSTSNIAFPTLASLLNHSPNWFMGNTTTDIFNDPNFQRLAAIPPKDPTDIASYQGIVFIRSEKIGDYEAFHQKYPGILVSGAPSYNYWIDKYKMTLLFDTHPMLKKIKPEWGLYPKKYTPALANQIIEEIPADFYVIKPRGAFLGQGVIILPKDKLDATLRYILTKNNALRLHFDKSYSYWYEDPFDSFLIEKYYPSDLIQVQALENKTYQPTLRAVFSLAYNNEKIDFRFFGAYWIVPQKSVDEEGSHNDVKKACCRAPFFAKATDDVIEEVRKELEITMPLLYEQML
jgi:hypothetical protein